jgi:hypothetical protein
LFPTVKLTPPAAFTLTVAVAFLVASATDCAVMVTSWSAVTFPGAVYSPLEEMVPTAGLRLQLTAVFGVPVTVAVNCCACPAFSVTVAGLTDTKTTGISVSTALANFVLSIMLVAITSTVWLCRILLGAVYTAVVPLVESVPTAGFKLHTTPVFVVPVTVAVNCCV